MVKHPVPYELLTIPGLRHCRPSSEACWSPRIPVMGTAAGEKGGTVCPKAPADEQMRGRIEAGMLKKRSSSGSHCRRSMLYSSVLEALEASVT